LILCYKRGVSDDAPIKPERDKALNTLQEKLGLKKTRFYYRNKARERSTLLTGPELGSRHPHTVHNGDLTVSQLIEKGPALKPLEAEYVKNVAAGMLPSTAARAAGYKNVTQAVKRLTKKPATVAAVLREKNRTAEKNDMNRKRVMDGFLEAIGAARQQSDPLAMISGWREIAKMCGYYEATKHRVEISVNGQVMHTQMQTMSDAELLKLAEGDAQVVEGEVLALEDKQD